MNISVNGKQFRIGESLRAHIEHSISQISGKYFTNPIDASVTIARDGSTVRADINVHVGRRMKIHGQGHAAEPYAAFDSAGEKIDKRLRRFKRRIRDHHRKGDDEHHSTEAQEVTLAASEDAALPETPHETREWQPVVVAEATTQIQSLTVEEAVMHMDLTEVPVVMFRNAGHGELNVVFRRRDGNIGWIDPRTNLSH